jgi:hypothetical protein
VVVGAGIVITCIGLGTALSLGVFLQPMSVATGVTFSPPRAEMGALRPVAA